MNHDQDIIREFVVEIREGLDRIDDVLVALEATPQDRSRLDAVFRALHTMKGNAGFLDFPKLGKLAHAGESLISKLISGKLKVQLEIIELLFRLVDAIRGIVAEVEANGDEGTTTHDGLIREIAEWGESALVNAPPVAEKPIESEKSPERDQPVVYPESTVMDPTQVHTPKSSVPANTVSIPPLTPLPALPAIQNEATQGAVASEPSAKPAPASDELSSDEDTPKPTADSASAFSLSGKMSGNGENSTVIRVQIDHLDDLMNLVGELVLTRNRIVQITASREDDELTEPIQRLNRLTVALQDGVMRTRMQPVRNAWKKYPRIVRDLARQCGKQCEVELQGGDTELDKSMLEAIADPLVHLVRNAIDHGIEKPYLRKIKGKPETGRLLVKSFQESGQVHIEISDDGAGLDIERIRKKAIEVGVISPERAKLISETELRNSVFLPGFTTADRLTNLSGRGVGMDVVKTCIEQIGGAIELQTQKDVGTTIRLTVPLTLAIVPAVMVGCGTQRFAVPQINVVEMLRLEGDDRHIACDRFYDTPILRLRGELLPMADLPAKLQLGQCTEILLREKLEILVVKTGTRRFALLVDEIGDAQEIVVKPLGDLLASQNEYSGAALMGDGTIALILDVLGIARSTGLLTTEQSLLNDSAPFRESAVGLEEQVLICQVDGERQVALPLADVVCLEQIPVGNIEHSATGDVLQYRGEILPLHQLSHQTPIYSLGDQDEPLVSVVIYSIQNSWVGLMVDRIVDVAPRPLDLRPIEPAVGHYSRATVVASAVVLGRITDFLQLS